MNKFFDVYAGNIPVTISPQNLKDLFLPMGPIASVWIKGSHDNFTYGFVSFYRLNDAKKACEVFNSPSFDKLMIKVSLSLRNELSNSVTDEDLLMISSLPKTRSAKPSGIIDSQKINLQTLNDIVRYY